VFTITTGKTEFSLGTCLNTTKQKQKAKKKNSAQFSDIRRTMRTTTTTTTRTTKWFRNKIIHRTRD